MCARTPANNVRRRERGADDADAQPIESLLARRLVASAAYLEQPAYGPRCLNARPSSTA
jgi:hypothetical protein